MRIHITEHKSTGTLNPLTGRTVRVFVNNDYHYGYFVDEHALFAMLSAEQQADYLAGNEAKLDVTPQTAQRIINMGDSPYAKALVCPEIGISMTRQSALDYLGDELTCVDDTVAERYDDDAQLREAIQCLLPGFEYPDISHLTLAQLYRRCVQQS